jgi:hypothetical protein
MFDGVSVLEYGEVFWAIFGTKASVGEYLVLINVNQASLGSGCGVFSCRKIMAGYSYYISRCRSFGMMCRGEEV